MTYNASINVGKTKHVDIFLPLEQCQIDYELIFNTILYFWHKSVIKLRFIEMEKGGIKLKIDVDPILQDFECLI